MTNFLLLSPISKIFRHVIAGGRICAVSYIRERLHV